MKIFNNIFLRKKILIYGLGKSGISSYKFLKNKSDVYLFDDNQMLHTLNDRFRVYKCIKTGIGKFYNSNVLSIGQGGWLWDYKSYNEPVGKDGQNGNYTDNFMKAGGEDGYQWKFLYTIAAGEALKFVTTSYIPVRTIRQANGVRPKDYCEQYEVETNASNGGIMNVVDDRIEQVYSNEVVGYEPLGGSGYSQFRVQNLGSIVIAADSMTISFDTINLNFRPHLIHIWVMIECCVRIKTRRQTRKKVSIITDHKAVSYTHLTLPSSDLV